MAITGSQVLGLIAGLLVIVALFSLMNRSSSIPIIPSHHRHHRHHPHHGRRHRPIGGCRGTEYGCCADGVTACNRHCSNCFYS